MREMGVRGLLVYCSDFIAAILSRLAAIDARMMFVCQTWSRISSATLTAPKVPTSGRISIGRKAGRWFQN